MEDIVLFLKYNFHMSGLKPVSDCLNESGIKHTITSKRHLVYDHYNETKKKFRLMVIADEWASLFLDCSEEIMNISHSMVSKNVTFSPKNSDMSYLCVPSQYYKNEFIKRGITPKKNFFITGFPYADKIFNQQWNKDTWWYHDALKKDINQVNVLFCPTYNKELSLIDDFILNANQGLFENFYELFKANKAFNKFRFALKSHPVLPKKYPEQIEEIKNLQNKYGKSFFYYHEESHSDITDAILWSDIIIGDSSGAMLLAIPSDKPILAFNNKNKKRSGYYDSNGPEWIFRKDFATEFNSFDIFNEELLEEIYKFDPKRKIRTEVKNLLYGEHQGTAAMQIANQIVKLL